MESVLSFWLERNHRTLWMHEEEMDPGQDWISLGKKKEDFFWLLACLLFSKTERNWKAPWIENGVFLFRNKHEVTKDNLLIWMITPESCLRPTYEALHVIAIKIIPVPSLIQKLVIPGPLQSNPTYPVDSVPAISRQYHCHCFKRSGILSFHLPPPLANFTLW